MGLLVTIAVNGLLALGAYWTAAYGFQQPRGRNRWLGAFVLAWIWADLGMELAGTAGVIAAGALLVWAAAGACIGAVFRWRRAGAVPETSAVSPEVVPVTWDAIVALGIVLTTAALIGTRSLVYPLKVVSDGPIYHLYFAARWWKEGRIFPIAVPFGESAATYFPAVGDLWFTWLMTCWGGDRLARVGQAPFLLVAASSTWALARRLGAGSSAALVASLWFVTSPPLFLFSFEPNVDTIFVAGYLTAVAFFLEYACNDRRGSTLALGALAAGGALGAKATAIVFVPPLLVLAAVLTVARRGSRNWIHAALTIVLPLVMAGPWYLRNALLSGNPLYPLHLKVLGTVWLSGWYGPDAMDSSPYYLRLGDWPALIDLLLHLLDPRLTPVWCVALVGGWALVSARGPRDRWLWGLSALAVVNIALYWVLIPYRTQQRFMLHALGLMAVPLARLFSGRPVLRWAGSALLAIHLVTGQAWPFATGSPPWDLSPIIPNAVGPLLPLPRPTSPHAAGEVVLMLAVGLAAMVTAWTWARATSGSRRTMTRALVASAGFLGLVVALTFPAGATAAQLFYPPFRDYQEAWRRLELRTGASGVRIAYAGTDIPYYLLGVGLRNQVQYVNVDRHRDWLMHDYHRAARGRGMPTWSTPRPGWDRLEPNYEAWLANLRHERIQVLVVARVDPTEGTHYVADPQGFPIERGWAESHPEVFEPLYGVSENDPRMRVYRLRPDPRSSARESAAAKKSKNL